MVGRWRSRRYFKRGIVGVTGRLVVPLADVGRGTREDQFASRRGLITRTIAGYRLAR
jgi:hypothetical protein